MQIQIAILGLGTVGYGVYEIITKSERLHNVNIKKILDKDLTKQDLVNNSIITDNFQDIINDNDISIIIEAMGAGEYSYYTIKEAIIHDKHVITANKEVIASHLLELTNLKNEHHVSLYYEASVGGGIPIIKPLYTISEINDTNEIMGILNGTTNFILTKMTQNNLSFKDALGLAQENGFAESDPTNDLEGLDMVRKIAILSSIAYHGEVNIDRIYHYGISTVSLADIAFAKENGYVIKLIAYSNRVEKETSLRIEPWFIPTGDLIASVNNEFNFIKLQTNYNGELMFYGKGAGRYPTANAMVNDLLMIINNDKNYSFEEKNRLTFKENKYKNKYYIRVMDTNIIDEKLIQKKEKNMIITNEIPFNYLEEQFHNIYFYAKIK